MPHWPALPLSIGEDMNLQSDLVIPKEIFTSVMYMDYLLRSVFESDLVCIKTLEGLMRRRADRYQGALFAHVVSANWYRESARHLADNWYEYAIKTRIDTGTGVVGSHKMIYLLKHYHKRSDLVSVSARLDKRRWACYTCEEEAPKSVIFATLLRGL